VCSSDLESSPPHHSRTTRAPSRGTSGTSSSRWTERWDGPAAQPRRTPPVPRHTNPLDCRRAEAGTGWTRGLNGWALDDPTSHWRLGDRRLGDWWGDWVIG